MEHDFQIQLMFGAAAMLGGYETMKADGWRRWGVLGATLTCLALALFWPVLKPIYSPAAALVGSIAVNAETWFVFVILAFLSIAATGRQKLALKDAQVIAAENPALDLVFGDQSHYPTAVKTVNVHRWYVHTQHVRGVSPDGVEQYHNTFTYIHVLFSEKVSVGYVKITANKTLPSFSVLDTSHQHIIIHFDGDLAHTALSIRVNEN